MVAGVVPATTQALFAKAVCNAANEAASGDVTVITTVLKGVVDATLMFAVACALDVNLAESMAKSGIKGDINIGVIPLNVPSVELFAIQSLVATATLPTSDATILAVALSSDCDDEIVMPPKVRMVRIKPAIVQSSCGDMVLS